MSKLAWTVLILAAARLPCPAAEPVRVTETTKTILTGPFRLEGLAPQQRPEQFKPVEYPAVYIDNGYLRCCVLPTVGGRLYEVYSKASKSQLFFVNPYLETHPDDFEGGHPWNLGGVEVNFPYFHHGNTYNDRWQWAALHRRDGSAGVAMGFTSRPTMQRAVFRVLLRPGSARVHLEYRFENLNPYSWGLAAWIDTMHTKTMHTQFILPSPWVAGHGHNVTRTRLEPWPVRNGVDLSWQRNVPARTSLSEFAFMPRLRFHGCYEHATDRGAVRIFDPTTLPAAKLWTQAPPVTPQQYYQHFEIWTATSAVMEDPGRQPELSAHTAADSWYQAWGIGAYVFANELVALNLARPRGGMLLAGACGTTSIPNCVVSLRSGHRTLHREVFALDPATPWNRHIAAPDGDVTMEIVGPDGARIASYELREDDVPREQWAMPQQPRWHSGINAACHEEAYSTLWRRREHFLDGAIRRYAELLKQHPRSATLMVDLARAYLKDEQARVGYAYREPGRDADAHAARQRASDLHSAARLLRQALAQEPDNAQAHFLLGLAVDRQDKADEADDRYRAALKCRIPAPVAGMYLARRTVKNRPAEAVAAAQRTAAAYPQSTRARQMLLVALAAEGKVAEALTLGKALHGLDPTDPVTAWLVGRALRRAGRADEARLWLRRAETLCAEDPQLRRTAWADLEWLHGQRPRPEPRR